MTGQQILDLLILEQHNQSTGSTAYQLDPKHVKRLQDAIPNIRILMEYIMQIFKDDMDAGVLTTVYLMGILCAEKVINREIERLEMED